MTPELPEVLSGQLALPTTSWSMGEFGALGEFHHLGASSLTDLTLDSTDGSLAVDHRPCTAIAYETISARPGRWLHGVALCLPAEKAGMNRRRVITALGLDTNAVRAQDRSAWLFDLGLGLTTVDFCIRTADPSLLQILRNAEGNAVLSDQLLFERLRQASPHRVLLSRLARLEVRSLIPPRGQASPPGSHTHLLPHLLHRRRAHSANVPVPAHLLPCLYLYPAHPLHDDGPGPERFDMQRHDAFQALMRSFGAPDQLDAKREIQDAIRRGEPPRALRSAHSRHGRLAIRVTLRQLAAQGIAASRLERWEAAACG